LSGHIVAMGGARSVMDRRDDPFHDYVLELTGKSNPAVLFLGTATGDDPGYIVTFYETFNSARCRPRHLNLFGREHDDITELVLGADVVHVGGGNTANMLDVWKRQGVDLLLPRALAGGAVLAGGSAGGICWFQGGTTDSYGPTLRVLQEGLGLVKASFSPHYDSGDQRRPLYHAAIRDGSLPYGYAAWDRAALRFDGTGRLVEAVTSQPGARALSVYLSNGDVVEEDLPCRVLQQRPVSRPGPAW
jgi:dipeptidase E